MMEEVRLATSLRSGPGYLRFFHTVFCFFFPHRKESICEVAANEFIKPTKMLPDPRIVCHCSPNCMSDMKSRNV